MLLSANERYEALVRRVQTKHGELDAKSALRLMDRPVAMKSNLHNVLFAPASTKFWVAHATTDGRPAAEQPYHGFQLTELLTRRPDAEARSIAFEARRKSDVETARKTKDSVSNATLQTK